jgi:hypothetical protein
MAQFLSGRLSDGSYATEETTFNEEVCVRIIHQRRGIASLTVHGEGIGMCYFSQQELQQFVQLVAGKTPLEALHILLGLPGIGGSN